MKRTTAALASALLVISLSACDDTDSQPTKAETQTVEVSEEAQAAAEESADEETQQPEQEAEAKYLQVSFGETAQWADGTTVTISEPQPYEIENEYTRADYPGQIVSMSVTMHNGSDEPVNAFMPTITGTSGGRAVESVFDENHDLPMADIMPGKDLTWDQSRACSKVREALLAVDEATEEFPSEVPRRET